MDATPERAGRVAVFSAVLGVGFVSGMAAVYAFVWLAAQVIGHEIGAVDAAAFESVRLLRGPVLDVVARIASFLGNEALYVIGAVLLVAFVRQRRWGAAALMLLVGVGAQLLSNTLKLLFQRARPEILGELTDVQTFAFPSGHAMVSTACYGFLVYLAWHRFPSGRWPILATAIVLVGLIGASRVYLGVHYVTDVLAGFIAGFVWLDAVLIGARLLRGRP
jgi:membrane-associated phospholipid phosphatase